MARVPRKVRIGPIEYRISQQRIRTESEGVYGLHDPDNAEIVLRPNVSPDIKSETLFHELIHACFHVAGISERNEERVVSSLSPVLFDAIRRNPALCKYLFGDF